MVSTGVIKVRSAAVLIQDEKLLLGRHRGHDFFAPIGGSVEFGEDLRQACRREVKEETGLRVVVKEMLHLGEFLSAGQHALDALFYCELASSTKGVTRPGDASLLEITWLPLARLSATRVEPHEFWEVLRGDPGRELGRLRRSPQYVGPYRR